MLSSLRRSKRFDDRIYQSVPQWTVEQGAVSLTSANFQSLSATAGFVNFQIQSPSKAVYLDRKVDWQMTVTVAMSVDCTQVTVPAPFAVATPGRDFSLCSYPLHALTNSMSATICDQQVSTNLAQNREIMDRLTDSPMDREWSCSPTALDLYADNNEAYGSLQNPMQGFDSSTTFQTIGNGAWPIIFTDPSGAPASSVVTGYTDANNNVIVFDVATGVPKWVSNASTTPSAVLLYFQFTSSEPLQCSPFIWKDVMERRTGLSQLQNLNVSMTIQSAQQAKLLRCTSANQRSVNSYVLNPIGGSPFQQGTASLFCQFLSPPMTAELPYQPVNTVEYQGITAYVYPCVAPLATGPRTIQVTTQTLSLNTVPDWLVIAVQPTPAYSASQEAINQGTWYMPILSANVTWSNVTGLLSNLTQQQLFQICKCNGLKQPYAQWRGYAQTSSSEVAAQTAWLTGGPLILRPGVDVTLPPGVASGQSNGQWTFSIQLTIDASAVPAAVLNGMAGKMQTTVLAINSGFFSTSSGTSRVVTGPIPGPAGGTNPENPYALAGIPSAGPLMRPSVLQLTDGDRIPGGGRAPRRMRMSDRLR